jgi:hypothetical protein
MSKKLTTAEFISNAVSVHGDRYDYSNVEYINTHTLVVIGCRIHGMFKQVPVSHKQGIGCAKCAFDNHRTTLLRFIEQSRLVHNNLYDYSKVDYIDTKTKVIINCFTHGIFKQKPNDHLSGVGCAKCSDNSSNTLDFIRKALLIHGNKYDYSEVNYTVAHSKIIIKCVSHGMFIQKPICHLLGQGCPSCTSKISKIETMWLDSHRVPNDQNHRQVSVLKNKRIKVDGFIPETNTVYEFWGDYWHGHPTRYKPSDINPTSKKTFGDLYEKTQQKRQAILAAGYNLVEIWESDWDTQSNKTS